MKTIEIKTIILTLFSLSFGAQDLIAQGNISIELMPKEYKDSTINIQDTILFLVKLINNSKDTLNFYEEWNSWGFWNIEFELIKSTGKHIKIKRESKGWDKNFASCYLIKPNQHVFIPIYNQKDWWFWPNLIEEIKSKCEIIAIYTQPSLELKKVNNYEKYNQYKLWSGSIKSRIYKIKEIIKK